MNTISSINTRAETLLKLLVSRYIKEGQPVSSKSLAHDTSINVSSATVRNVMSELEDLGYLRSPHTSAGRVPTDRAYRLFVNHLIQTRAFDGNPFQRLIEAQMNTGLTTNELIKKASSLVSDLTNLAGIISAPARQSTRLKHIEFLALSNKRILAVIVLNNREVQNKIIETEREFSTSELQAAGNFINQHYAGQNLAAIREALTQSLHKERVAIDQAIKAALDLAERSFTQESEGDYIVSGETKLLDISDPDTLNDLKSLLDAFAEKNAITQLFNQCLNADDVQIFIGRESGHDVFEDWSIVASPYYADGDIVGVLGVVGPQRMAYDQVISVVDVTAKLLTTALKE